MNYTGTPALALLDSTDDAAEARMEYFDATHPYWEVASNPERFVSESDLPVYDTTADAGLVPSEDWDAMAEAMWTEYVNNI